MRIFCVVPLLMATACSLTTDFDRFDREHPDAATTDASAVDADTDAGAMFDCAGVDPARLFCSSFSGADPTAGWEKAIIDNSAAGDSVTLDSIRFASPPASGRFFVSQGDDRYAMVFLRLTPATRPLAHDAFGRFYLEPQTPGEVTLLSLSGLDEADYVALRYSSTGSSLVYRNGASVYDVAPLQAAVPTGRFFAVVLHRDDGARTASLDIDGVPATSAPMALRGARPPGEAMELRVGVGFAQKTTASVTVWVDDVGIRRR